VWSSAAVAHLLQGSTCCKFRDARLHNLVVTSGEWSYCCLPISSKQSDHSLLNSGINKAFSPRELLLTGYFLFFGPFSVNLRDGCVDQQFLKYSNQLDITLNLQDYIVKNHNSQTVLPVIHDESKHQMKRCVKW